MAKAFENIQGKVESAGNQHFLFIATMFRTQSAPEIIVLAVVDITSADTFNLAESKVLSFSRKLTHFIIIASHY